MLTIILLSVGLITSIILNVLLYRALSIQLNKISIYETWVKEYEEWVDSVRNSVRSTYLKMKEMDNKGWFFKDEEVGIVFSELLDLLKRLNDKIQ